MVTDGGGDDDTLGVARELARQKVFKTKKLALNSAETTIQINKNIEIKKFLKINMKNSIFVCIYNRKFTITTLIMLFNYISVLFLLTVLL